MQKVTLGLVCAAFVLGAGMSGCQSINDLTSFGEDGKRPAAQDAAAKEQQAQEPQMSDAQLLSELSSDAGGPVNMQSNPRAVRQGVSLADRLENAPQSHNALLGAADPYTSVKEVQLSESDEQAPFITDLDEDNTAHQAGVTVAGASAAAGAGVAGVAGQRGMPSQVPAYSSESELGSASCEPQINLEASGVARALIKDLAARLRNEGGNIYVAPTIIDSEYQDCMRDLSSALQDGLSDSTLFKVVPATVNLNNIISQNIGSATILPSLIHQCRASSIPYLVVSQVKKTGDKAALTLRIIRTEDGITLSQTYRRLHN